jgi:hypothetical protein
VTRCSRELFDGFIDYAGLFPPAELPMDQAFRRYLEHRRSGQGWMLARFVCPTGRLHELALLLGEAPHGEPPLAVAALGRGGDTLEQFNGGVDEDATAIREFSSQHGSVANVDVFEVGLPRAGGAAVAVEHTWHRLAEAGPVPITPFFEVSIRDDWRPRLPAAAAAVRDTNRAIGRSRQVGLKIRCGGLEAAAVPEPPAVAAAIATCRAVGVPLKATQGLHHAFRHHDPALGTEVHGFLNLFIASIMAQVHDLPVTHLTDIVAETDPAAFSLSDDAIGWRDFKADARAIAAARRRLLTSFGSCSFAEPREDLRSLGLID